MKPKIDFLTLSKVLDEKYPESSYYQTNEPFLGIYYNAHWHPVSEIKIEKYLNCIILKPIKNIAGEEENEGK